VTEKAGFAVGGRTATDWSRVNGMMTWKNSDTHQQKTAKLQ